MKKKTTNPGDDLREMFTDFIYLVVAVIGFVATMFILPFAVCEIFKYI